MEEIGELNAKELKPVEDRQRGSGLGIEDRRTIGSWPIKANDLAIHRRMTTQNEKRLRAKDDERLRNQ